MKRKEHRDGLKHCVPCNRWRDPACFHKNRRNWDGLHAYCVECMADGHRRLYSRDGDRIRAKTNAYNRANPEKRKAIALRFKFGLELEDYNRMLAEQDGKCAICRRDRELHVDHSHETGMVRGLLCMPCNVTLGHMGDSAEILRAAAAYLEVQR